MYKQIKLNIVDSVLMNNLNTSKLTIAFKSLRLVKLFQCLMKEVSYSQQDCMYLNKIQ